MKSRRKGRRRKRKREGRRRGEPGSRFKKFTKKNTIELVCITPSPPLSFAPPSSPTHDYDNRKSRASCDLDLLGLLSLGAKERKNLCFRRRTAAAADGAGMEE